MTPEQLELSVSQQENVNDSIDYIEALKEMKQNSVTRESYDKLKGENKKLLDALVNGQQLDLPKEAPVDIDQLKKDLYGKNGKNLSNLEYVSKTLQLREQLIANGEQDPFLPYGNKVTITAEHIDAAQRAADVLQQCVDFADGDSGIFSAELQRRTKEVMPAYNNRYKR